jgi:F-type H+-transporting ATPase subunit b
MDQILEQLGGLFLSSIPSVILLILLYFFLKLVLFDPLEKILAERYRKTEGREKDALEALREAERKAEEYAHALHAAKAEIYSQQEALRKNLEAGRATAIAAAAERTEALLAEGRASVEAEFQTAQATVEQEAGTLARLVADKVLFREAT